MDRDANEGTPHTAALQQLIDQAVNRFRGKRHWSAARQRRIVETEHTALRINQWSTGKTIVDGEVQPQHTIEASALPRAPTFADRADDAETRGHVAPGPSNRKHQCAHVYISAFSAFCSSGGVR